MLASGITVVDALLALDFRFFRRKQRKVMSAVVKNMAATPHPMPIQTENATCGELAVFPPGTDGAVEVGMSRAERKVGEATFKGKYGVPPLAWEHAAIRGAARMADNNESTIASWRGSCGDRRGIDTMLDGGLGGTRKRCACDEASKRQWHPIRRANVSWKGQVRQ
ncbi:hypothetical protein MKZ38_000145 [Zalerion maritima]|uniref:Uncharacterized protein n=1 Tax=Zalerion maritima TaxID=339359 RepID=A0AAD5RFR0_9PEZI|nr:hypothetical protein MKZ38_000145 [Zalerion maritima]